MTFKGFLKTLSYILGIFITVLILSGISYLIIDGINKKSNVMDIGEYSPVSTLVVPANPTYKSKFPFVDVHSHHWDMPVWHTFLFERVYVHFCLCKVRLEFNGFL